MRTQKQAPFALPSLLLAMAYFTPTAFAEVVKVRKEGVRLFAEASGSAKVLRTLKKDELINMRHRFGSFLAVDAGANSIGYVRALDTVKVADK